MPNTEHFSLRINPAPTFSSIISVSKKVSPKAVVRNRVKRRIRPLISEFKKDLPPAQYLLIVKPSAKELKGSSLKEALAQVLKIR